MVAKVSQCTSDTNTMLDVDQVFISIARSTLGADCARVEQLIDWCHAEDAARSHGVVSMLVERGILAANAASEITRLGSGGNVRDAALLFTPPGWAWFASEFVAPHAAQPQCDLLANACKGQLAGRLELVDLTRLLSIVEPLQFSGVLRVTDGESAGEVHLVRGVARHATFNGLQGFDALFLLLLIKKGTFRLDTDPPSSEQTVFGNTMNLLLESIRQMDEAKDMLNNLGQSGLPQQSGENASVEGAER